MINKVVQVATEGENSRLIGEVQSVIDKEGEGFIVYQIRLKQYLSDIGKYNADLEKCFSIIIGQCSPAMEQSLAANNKFEGIKSASNSIALIKILEHICFNYQSHEYPPLGAWEAIDALGRTVQSDTMLEAN